MKLKAGTILLSTVLILFGCLGCVSGVGGLLIFSFGFLADEWQLKLDTNLDKSSVMLTGAGGIIVAIILIAIPLAIWLLKKKH